MHSLGTMPGVWQGVISQHVGNADVNNYGGLLTEHLSP